MPTANLIEPDLLRGATDLRVAIGRLVRRMRQGGVPGDPTPSEISVLKRLDQDGPSGPAALADAEQVSPPVISLTLAALLRRGLVCRDRDEADGRRVVMSLTPAGAAEVKARGSALSQRVAGALTDQFSDAERRQLLAVVPLLQRLAEAL